MVLVRRPYGSFSNFGFTDPMMYKFMPTDIDQQKIVHQACTCAMLIYNTEVIYSQVLYWMYLCSLEATCCPPNTSSKKKYKDFTAAERLNMTIYKVKRFDQAMANLLLSNLFSYNEKQYSGVEEHLSTSRSSEVHSNITTC